MEGRGKNPDLTYRTLCQFLSGRACSEPFGYAQDRLCRRTDIALTSTLGPDDWCVLASIARREGVAPLLYHGLNAAGWLADVPPSVQADLRQAYYTTTAVNLLIYRELSRILTALCPLPVVALKGSALAATLYSSIGLRPIGDLDLLVPEEHLAEAVARLKALGYVEFHPEMAIGLNALTGYDVRLQGGCDVHLAVELHWNLIPGGEENRYGPRIEWFWERTEMADLAGVQALVLKPTAHLLCLAAHLALKHGEAYSPLRWFYDIHLLVTREGHRIDWNELILRAQEFRWTSALHAALAGTAVRFATPLPAGLLESLIEGTNPGDQALVQRKARPQTRGERVSDVLASLGWRARLRLVLANVAPSPAYMRWRYEPQPASLWPLCYPYRWLDILREGLATALKLAMRGGRDGAEGSPTGRLSTCLTIVAVWVVASLLAIAYISSHPYLGLGIALLGGIAFGVAAFLSYGAKQHKDQAR